MADLFDKDGVSGLPESLDWQNMEQGILQKMDRIEKAQAPSKAKNRRGFYAVLLALLLGLGWGMYEIGTGTGAGTESVQPDYQNQVDQQSNGQVPENLKQELQKKVQPTEERAMKVSEQVLVATTELAESQKTNTDKSIIATAQKEGQKAQPESLDQETSLEEKAEADPWVEVQDQNQNIGINQAPADTLKMVDSLESKASPLIPRAPRAWRQLILEGGIALWDDQAQQDRYEGGLISYQLQGHYLQEIRNNYFWMLGFQYQQLESKFEYRNQLTDYVITLEDTVIQVQRNRLTGEQQKVYGDVEQRVSAERHVRHYNTTRLVKLSLGLGKAWYFGAFQGDLYGGAAINGLTINHGRNVLQNEIVDYSGSSNEIIDNTLLLEAYMGLRIQYKLSPQLSLTSSLQMQKSLMNWSAGAETQWYPLSASLQFGLAYRY